MWGVGNWRGIRQAAGLALLVAVAGSLLLTSSASAASSLSGPIRVAGAGKQWKVLLPLKLPLLTSGQRVNGRVTLNLPRGEWSSALQFVAHGGPLRPGDRREHFTYVQGVGVPLSVARAALKSPSKTGVRLRVNYRLPVLGDSGAAEGFTATQRRLPRARAGFCETLPRLVVRPSRDSVRNFAPPTCGRKLNWRIVETPDKGRASRQGERFGFLATGESGADEIVIEGFLKGHVMARQRVQVRLIEGAPSKVSVVAMGDSVTAGFGYFGSTGQQMGITQLLDCKPGATVLNDACSSNSTNRNSSVGAKPNYLPDFGLSRNISWAAQWANQYGITNYRNYAVTGSAPSDWLTGGQFNSTLQSIEAQNPDYILMTIGANPLLSDVLFGLGNMECALESDLFGDFRECVLDAFEAVNLDDNLNSLYSNLVANTTSRIVLMQYHIAVPATALAYSSAQLEAMTELLNGVIAEEAAEVSSSRITVVAPPRFDVGIDMEPLYPSKFSCSFLGYKVDGPSVQSSVTQKELLINHPLSFCSGPAIGSPWIISGDTGIHPSATGYMQMAGQVPAPGS